MASALAGSIAAAALVPFTPKSATTSVSARPDARLLKLGAKFNEAYSRWVPLCNKMREAEASFIDAYKREYGDSDRTFKKAWALPEAAQFLAASEINNKAIEVCNDLSNEIREIPATTIAGLAVKARVVRFDTFSPWEFTDPPEDMDWGPKVFPDFLAEIDRLASGTVFDLQNKVAAAVSVAGEPASNPDAELLNLCEAWRSAYQEADELGRKSDDIPMCTEEYQALEQLWQEAGGRAYKLELKISQIQATTAEGFMEKLSILRECEANAIDVEQNEILSSVLADAEKLIRA